jgi:hypothetical protein
MGVMLFIRPLNGRVSDSKEFRKLDGDDADFGAVEKLFRGDGPGEPERFRASRTPGSKLLLLLLLLLFLFFGKNDSSDAGILMIESTWPSVDGWTGPF